MAKEVWLWEGVSGEMNFLESICATMEAFGELAFDLDPDTSSIVIGKKSTRKNSTAGRWFSWENGLVPDEYPIFLITRRKLTLSSKHGRKAGYMKVSERRCKMVILELCW